MKMYSIMLTRSFSFIFLSCVLCSRNRHFGIFATLAKKKMYAQLSAVGNGIESRCPCAIWVYTAYLVLVWWIGICLSADGLWQICADTLSIEHLIHAESLGAVLYWRRVAWIHGNDAAFTVSVAVCWVLTHLHGTHTHRQWRCHNAHA